MDLEDKTPQNENRDPIAEISFLTLGDCVEPGLDGFLAESGDVGSVETSPSSEEPSLARNRTGNDGGEENMSQSYHEIFDTQAYIQSHLASSKQLEQDTDDIDNTEKVDEPTKEKHEVIKPLEKQVEKPEETPSKSTSDQNAEENKSGEPSDDMLKSPDISEERLKSPDNCSDQVSSGNSGNTETGQPFIPQQGDVYLEDGRLVSEDDSPLSRDFLTNKLVADSIMWQEAHQGASGENISPQEEEAPLPTAPQRGEIASVRLQQENISINSMSDPVMLLTIEREARRLASDVDSVVENLACILQSISALTVETVETYRDGVCKTCDSVDDNIKGMYRLIARWEELNKSMVPCYRLSSQIKDIRKVVDTFDASLNNSGTKG